LFLVILFLSSAFSIATVSSNQVQLVYAEPDESDAVLLTEDSPNKKIPKSMLVYTEFADHDTGSYGELKNTLGVVNEYFRNDYHIDNLTDYTELNSVISNYDVLLIPEQEYIYQDNITDISTEWSTPLTNFVTDGGVLVLLDCNGVYVPDGPGLKLLNETGLISVFSTADFSSGTLTVVNPNNALARNLPDTYPPSDGSVRFEITDGTAVVNDTISTVVAHKAMGKGHIALLGFDFWDFDEEQKIILRNAIQLSRHVVFDQSHSPHYTIQGDLVNISMELVDQGFAVSSMSTFSPEILAGCDVLVLQVSSIEYNATEVTLINTFVEDGGGLFIVTEFGSFGEELDPVTDHFGFVRNKSSSNLEDTDDFDTASAYIVYNTSNFESHSVMVSVARVEFDKGGGFASIPANGIPLVTTDTDGTSFWSDGSPEASTVSISCNK